MSNRSGVLIVSASTGAGHVRAGEALRRAFVAQDSGTRVEHVDILDLAPSWVRSAYGGGFEWMAQRAPWLWRELYERTDGPADDRARWGPVAERLLFRSFRRLLMSGDWRVCLCTHFLPCQLVAGRAGLPPFALAVTDWTVHRYWVQAGVSDYFVATEAMAADMRARVPHARVECTGIPIATNASSSFGSEQARAELGLDPARPMVLVMGGSFGLGVEEAATAAITANVPGIQVVAVCGRNEGACERLEPLARMHGSMRVVGFVNNIERLMQAADVVITKPGGLSTSEAIALGKPLLLTRGIPGHEDANALELVRLGAALIALGPKTIQVALESAFDAGTTLENLRVGAARAGRRDAAGVIASRFRAPANADAA